MKSRIKTSIRNVWQSRFALDAMGVAGWNIASRAVLFLGSAYAAKCLGPANFGVSAQIQAYVQQVGLAYNGGVDPVASRRIAAEPEGARDILLTVLLARLGFSFILALIWIGVVAAIVPSGPIRNAWMWGALLLVANSMTTTYFFQGIGRLPLHAAITGLGSIAIAVIYWTMFDKTTVVGTDIAVLACVTLVVAGAASLIAPGLCAPNAPGAARESLLRLRAMLRQSWRYWVVAVATYLYNIFPLLLVAHFLGADQTGVYRAAFILAAALDLFFSSVNNLLLPRFVGWYQEGGHTLRQRQAEMLPVHGALGAATGIGAFFLAPTVFALFLGIEYEAGVDVFRLMVITRVVVFIGQIYAWGLVARQHDGAFMWLSLAAVAISLPLNLLLLPGWGLMGAALSGLVTETVLHVSFYLRGRGGDNAPAPPTDEIK